MNRYVFTFATLLFFLQNSDVEPPKYIQAADGLLARKSGQWAARKHYFLDQYCGITTTSMKKKFRLVYLDVMAGPGRCKILETGEEFDGSPLVALRHEFKEYIFVESDPGLAAALRERVARHPKASQVKVLPEDWISALESGAFKFHTGHLVVAFVDPTGISQIPLSAMIKLAAFPRIDLLVTIQHALSVKRNIQQFIKSEGTSALDAFLGDGTWRSWPEPTVEAFTNRVIDTFCDRIRAQGYIPTRLISVPDRNPYYFFTLFSRHPLAKEFWSKVTKIDERGQRDLEFE